MKTTAIELLPSHEATQSTAERPGTRKSGRMTGLAKTAMNCTRPKSMTSGESRPRTTASATSRGVMPQTMNEASLTKAAANPPSSAACPAPSQTQRATGIASTLAANHTGPPVRFS